MARISRSVDALNQRHYTVGVVSLFGTLVFAAFLFTYFHSTKPASSVTSVAEFFAEFPMHFQTNNGSFADRVKFFSKGYQYDLLFMEREVLLNLYSNEHADPPDIPAKKTKLSQISLQFVGGSGAAMIKGLEPLVLSSNEQHGLTGHSTSSFMELKYSNVFPGVDVYFHGKQKQLYYEFVLNGTADISALRMKVVGTKDEGGIDIDMHGNVLVHCRGKTMMIQKPAVYRLVNHERQPVNGYFFVTKHNEIRFREVPDNRSA
ncbi:MAG: hypothetical protein PVJ39_11935 [Gammaproteobacteria bacterium]